MRGRLSHHRSGACATPHCRPSRARVRRLGRVDILAVVLAIQVLGIGEAGAGYLNAAFGAGGVIGAAVTVTLVGRRRLAPSLAAGLLLWGASFVLLGLVPTVAAALVLIAAAGMGNSLADVAGRTLLQRTAREDVLARVFGVLEGVAMAGLALGSIAVPVLVALWVPGQRSWSPGPSFPWPWSSLGVVCGRSTPRRRSGRRDRAPPVSSDLCATVRTRARKRCARPRAHGSTSRNRHRREGDAGKLYYAVALGDVDVSIDGALVQSGGRCEGFGEIALLRDVRGRRPSRRKPTCGSTRSRRIPCRRRHRPSAELPGCGGADA